MTRKSWDSYLELGLEDGEGDKSNAAEPPQRGICSDSISAN